MKKQKSFPPLDLKVEEVGVLSLVADYAHVPVLKRDLEKVLEEATPRARKIGQLMISPPKKTCKGAYARTAKRFLDANESNMKNMRLLRALSPQPNVDR